MEIPESLVLQIMDQLTLVAARFPSEPSELRAKNVARVLRELKAHHEQQSTIVSRKAQDQPKP